MNVRDYLKGIKELDALIYCKQIRIKEMWSSVTYPGVNYEPRVQTSKNFNKRTDDICKIIELEKEVEEMQTDMKERQTAVKKAVSEFSNEAMARVIILRYVEFKDWNEIANKIGCSKRWVMELHKKAIKKMSESIEVHTENMV